MPGEPESHREQVTVPEEAGGSRLDTFLARRQTTYSRTFFQQLIKDGAVLVDGSVPKRSHVLEGGERLEVAYPPVGDPWPQPQDIPIDVLHEDDDIIVVNKRAGMVVHPAAGNPDGTLVNALLHHCSDLPGINGVKRPGLVHRLDRETSGAMVIAKNDRAMTLLSRAIKNRQVTRLYLALAIGEPDWREATIDAPIGRHPTMRIKRAVDGDGARDARTHVRLLARARGFSLLRCQLDTGRTHQIRVHLAHSNMPIAGDWLYGGTRERLVEKIRHAETPVRVAFQRLDRPFLHARTLSFRHPADNRECRFTAPLPGELRKLLHVVFDEVDIEMLLETEF